MGSNLLMGGKGGREMAFKVKLGELGIGIGKKIGESEIEDIE